MQIDVSGLGVKALTLQMKIRSHTPEIIGIFGGPPGLRHKFTGKNMWYLKKMDASMNIPLMLQGVWSKSIAKA